VQLLETNSIFPARKGEQIAGRISPNTRSGYAIVVIQVQDQLVGIAQLKEIVVLFRFGEKSVWKEGCF
jgi:hypothetical protein